MMKLLLDTNFLVDLYRFRIDLADVQDFLGPLELCVFSKTIEELKSMSTKAKHGKFAKVALQMIETNRMEILDSSNVDADTLKLNPKYFIVATNDEKLRKQLRQKGMKTIYLRARKHLAIG